ncbi:BtrH N-terminal domain-containing protein [Aurantivibrio plasticivorans]
MTDITTATTDVDSESPANPFAVQDTSFNHIQSAHCESGVAAGLSSHYGLPLSEPMAFGLAGALTFAYIPFIKLFGMPMIAYRMPPKAIIKGLQKRTGIKFEFKTFRNEEHGMAALDNLLSEGKPVGLQTNVYWLPYFPREMQFHFNGHNLIAFKKHEGDYLVSDPVFETALRCDAKGLKKARFAKGALAAKGLMYYPKTMPQALDLPAAIKKAIKANYKVMHAPLPFIGIKGIRYLGKQIIKLAKHPIKKDKHLNLYLGHIVRMQEEIGTGGAGFRFIYAAFLKEAAQHLEPELLTQASKQMTEAGDEWRNFALHASKMTRNRMPMDAEKLNNILNACADKEAEVWRLLKRLF